MMRWHDAMVPGLNVLHIVLGSLLLAIFTYRVYDKRPQLDVPRTDAEIRDYKRTGRHPRPGGFNGYRLVYGSAFRPGSATLLVAAALTLLGSWAANWHAAHHPPATAWRAGSVAGLLAACWLSVLAALVVHELRYARHARIDRLLAVAELPAASDILCSERLPGLLAVAAARRWDSCRVHALCTDADLAQATHINLRRAGVADRATVTSISPAAISAVLSDGTACPVGRDCWQGLHGYVPPPAGWVRLGGTWQDRLLGAASLGAIRPAAAYLPAG